MVAIIIAVAQSAFASRTAFSLIHAGQTRASRAINFWYTLHALLVDEPNSVLCDGWIYKEIENEFARRKIDRKLTLKT
jgi:hypothetical protein